jgi:hypothetical protein
MNSATEIAARASAKQRHGVADHEELVKIAQDLDICTCGRKDRSEL